MPLEICNISYHSAQDENLSKPILQDINFKVENGDFWGILGASGAGKTTLLKLLAGFIRPTKGKIRLSASKKNFPALDIGLVFQYPEQQFFQYTIADDLGYVLKQRRLPQSQIDERCDKVLAKVGLCYDKLKNRSPFTLSHGQQRRLAIACVLINNPLVLLLDEPTIGLDWRARQSVLHWIQKLNLYDKVTIIITGSSLEPLQENVQKLLLLDNGGQAFCGTADRLFSEPQTLTKAGIYLPPLLELVTKLAEYGYVIKYPVDDLTQVLIPLREFLTKQKRFRR